MFKFVIVLAAGCDTHVLLQVFSIFLKYPQAFQTINVQLYIFSVMIFFLKESFQKAQFSSS